MRSGRIRPKFPGSHPGSILGCRRGVAAMPAPGRSCCVGRIQERALPSTGVITEGSIPLGRVFWTMQGFPEGSPAGFLHGQGRGVSLAGPPLQQQHGLASGAEAGHAEILRGTVAALRKASNRPTMEILRNNLMDLILP